MIPRFEHFNEMKIYLRKHILLLNFKWYVKGLNYFITGSSFNISAYLD